MSSDHSAMCNIHDPRQKKRFVVIADDSVWNSSPYGNWRFLKNVDDSKNLREVLATFPFERQSSSVLIRTIVQNWGNLWPWKTQGKWKKNALDSFQTCMNNLIKLHRLSIRTWCVLILIKNMLHSQPMQAWLTYTPHSSLGIATVPQKCTGTFSWSYHTPRE